MLCLTKITRNAKTNCNRKLARGLTTRVQVFMLDDQLDNFTFDSTETNVVTAINLKSGEKTFVIEGAGFSNQATLNGSSGDYGFSISHGFRLIFFDDSPAIKRLVEAMCSRNDVAIAAKKKGKGAKWEGYGFNGGFKVNNLSGDTSDEATKGAIVLELIANDEDALPYTIIHKTSSVEDTDTYMATIAAADA
ncbi:hypothetical protein GCM10028803_00290 [Larkinella knui]|uniref:Uncharacterized protein n=1 Tax=Larkinella knui TaxID=2025310 RepID=A0A3P1CK56_9BACT|nr:hypothetical protein [Larkinella knui]RRB13436.1 hypothetical protein EHT87_14260 [Larkinella knui]